MSFSEITTYINSILQVIHVGFNVAKCNLGKVKFKTMPVSGRPTLRLRGDLFELSAGGASWFALHLLACLLACVKGHFARLFSSLFSLSTLPLASIWSGKYSTDWVQCDGAFGGGRSQGCHGYLLPRASLLPGSTNLFRHHLPSSSIVDEFNGQNAPETKRLQDKTPPTDKA